MESPISMSASDDIYGRPLSEWRDWDPPATISYRRTGAAGQHGHPPSPPSGAGDRGETTTPRPGTVTTDDVSGGATLGADGGIADYAARRSPRRYYTTSDAFEETDEAYNAKARKTDTLPSGTVR